MIPGANLNLNDDQAYQHDVTIEAVAYAHNQRITTINGTLTVLFLHDHGEVENLNPFIALLELHHQLNGDVRRVYDLTDIATVALWASREGDANRLSGRFRFIAEPADPTADPGPTLESLRAERLPEGIFVLRDGPSRAPLTERDPDDEDLSRWADELDTQPITGFDMLSEPQSDDVPDLLDRIATGVREWKDERKS